MNPPPPTRSLLQNMVHELLDQQWDDWASRHPHLAGALDRVQLEAAAVHRLEAEPALREALREADLTEAQLRAAWKVLQLGQHWLHVLLPA